MKIYDIDSLYRDPTQNDLYNMFVITFRPNLAIQYAEYTVPVEEVGRIDLVCLRMYQEIDSFDVIMSVNDIDNPLNIREGMSLLYPSYTAIPDFRINTQETIETRAVLLNANKLSRKDASRQKYLEENRKPPLPPNFAMEPEPQVRIVGDELIIG